MGGSGGGFFGGSSTPEELIKRLRDEEETAQDQAFETRVNEIIGNLLADYNDRNRESISAHLSTIKSALEQFIEDTVDLLYGGSVQKHTYVDGISDIDTLVLLNNTELEDLTPTDVKQYFVDRLKERLPRTDISSGKLAVTIKFHDAEIQILPAAKYRDGFKIPSPDAEQWSYIRPKAFANKMSEVNSHNNGKVVPVVKLVKSIISNLPDNRRLSGYHAEALSVEIFKDYQGEKTPKKMLKHFFNEAPKYVTRPITDSTGQSIHVDDYLGQEKSLQRLIIADTIARIGRRMKNADGAKSVEKWCDILGKQL
ncbi:nucleotidyltransferase [Metallumcola ferriviriculae]|uniref:Nucleotidyltransferase n=1 Tax=Metallumcola ferriviriculae TaxID=3039180 RepID=A0AAU0UMY1_9FIRM|nr:nucleotidyltransferase [Desulfitibacteraceae bacterium MK1]